MNIPDRPTYGADTPKVSVVVTTYNQEDTLAATLDSILEQQTDFTFEILVSDDASTDGTQAVGRSYAARFPEIVKYHRNDRNRGIRDNYFDTLLRARGEYIADCAGDDFWTDPRRLSDAVALLDASADTVMVVTDWQYFHPEASDSAARFTPSPGAPYAEHKRFAKGEMLLDVLNHSERPVVHLGASVYRASVFREAYSRFPDIFRESYIPCEDLQLKALYAARGCIEFIPRPTLAYRVGHSSATSTESALKSFDFYLASLRLTYRLAEIFNVSAEEIRSGCTALADYLVWLAFSSRDRRRLAVAREFAAARGLHLSRANRLSLLAARVPGLWRPAVAVKKAVSRVLHPSRPV